MLTSISRPASVVLGATRTCGRPSSLGKISTSRIRGRRTPLGIALPIGDYYLTIFANGIGQGNNTGFSSVPWLTGGDLVPQGVGSHGSTE